MNKDAVNNIDIYQDHIIELSKSNKYHLINGEDMTGYEHVVYTNTSCGDSVTMFFKLDPAQDGAGQVVSDIKTKVDGCVISAASVNVISSNIIGKTLEEISRIMPYDMHNMLGVKVSEMRAPCALMGLSTVHKFLDNKI